MCDTSLLDARHHIRSTADAIAAAAGCSPWLVVTVLAGRMMIVAAIVVWDRLLTLAAIVAVHHNLLLDHGCFLVVTVRLRLSRLRGA